MFPYELLATCALSKSTSLLFYSKFFINSPRFSFSSFEKQHLSRREMLTSAQCTMLQHLERACDEFVTRGRLSRDATFPGFCDETLPSLLRAAARMPRSALFFFSGGYDPLALPSVPALDGAGVANG